MKVFFIKGKKSQTVVYKPSWVAKKVGKDRLMFHSIILPLKWKQADRQGHVSSKILFLGKIQVGPEFQGGSKSAPDLEAVPDPVRDIKLFLSMSMAWFVSRFNIWAAAGVDDVTARQPELTGGLLQLRQ